MIELADIKTRPEVIQLDSGVDYYKLFYALKSTYSNCYMFESLVLPKQQDRYYTIGFDPLYVFSAEEDRLHIRGREDEKTIKTDNPYQYLRKLLPDFKNADPYQGGLVGYFSYEIFNYFETSQNLAKHPDFPIFEFGLYLDGLIFDSETSELTYYTYLEDRSAEVKKLIGRLDEFKIPEKVNKTESL